MTPPGHNPEDPLPCDDKGKCTCLRNVIGNKCDSCQDTYWNVGSGFGCEECLCNTTGSLNDSCDVITGQCPCKPGVTGRTCDQCQSDHYGFSEEGCQRKYWLKKCLNGGIYFPKCDRVQWKQNNLHGTNISYVTLSLINVISCKNGFKFFE